MREERQIPDRRVRQPDGTYNLYDVTRGDRFIDEEGSIGYDPYDAIIAYNFRAAEHRATDEFGPGKLEILNVEEGPVSAYSGIAEEDFEDLGDDVRVTYWQCWWVQGEPFKRED